MERDHDVSGLLGEYSSLFSEDQLQDEGTLLDKLTTEAEWTPQAAEHLMYLARTYGSFVLRNALAVSLALGIEDGEIGF